MARVELYSENSVLENRIGVLIYGDNFNNEDYSALNITELVLTLRQEGIKIKKRQHLKTIPFEYRSTRRPVTEEQKREFWEAYVTDNPDFEKKGLLGLLLKPFSIQR